MKEIIFCLACGGEITDLDNAIGTAYGDFHIDCWEDLDDDEQFDFEDID
jgi:hypothetical protein